MEGDYRATRASVDVDGSDDQEVSFTGVVLDDDPMAEYQREVEYNPFQGRDGLEGCSLTGLESALSRRRTVVTPTSTRLELWHQVRGDRTLEFVKVDVVERLVAHALTNALEDLECASNHLMGAFYKMEDGPTKDRVRETHREMTQAATHPLGHALRLLGSRFNDLGHRRRSNLAGSTSDRVLAQHIKQTPLGFDSLLESSL